MLFSIKSLVLKHKCLLVPLFLLSTELLAIFQRKVFKNNFFLMCSQGFGVYLGKIGNMYHNLIKGKRKCKILVGTRRKGIKLWSANNLNLLLPEKFKYMATQSFDELWNTLIESAISNPIDFPSYFSTHEIRKLSLTKLRIQEIREKVAQFSMRYSTNNRSSSKTWMENQYRMFLWAVLQFSEMVGRVPLQYNFDDWSTLAKMFDKPPILCNYFYLCSRKGRNNPWTQEEDNFLCQIMKIPQYKAKWTDIGMLMFFQSATSKFRKPKAIRQRWLNHLNPDIVKYQWSPSEDLTIFSMVLQEGKKWSKISKILKNRSEHAIKNRYNGLIGQKIRNSSFETKSNKEEKAIKIYISKLKSSFHKEKEEKYFQQSLQKECEQKQSENQQSLFNYRLNPMRFCVFQPTLIVHPQLQK